MFKLSKRLTILATATLLANAMPAFAQDVSRPQREGPRPETTNGVPHIQLGLEPVSELTELMLKHVAELSGVTLGSTRVSLPGAVGFQLNNDVDIANPEAIVGGREFALVHPDGSLHASLEPELARAAVKAGWATSDIAAAGHSSRVVRHARGWEKPSDHAPVFATFDL